jgi:hypothetical protein
MCLDRVTAREDEMLPAMIGYKIVEQVYSDRFIPVCSCEFMMGALIGGGWALRDSAEHHITSGDGYTVYIPGVHAWMNVDDANRHLFYGRDAFVVVKVLLRGPICKGLQDYYEVVVYREMTILEVL